MDKTNTDKLIEIINRVMVNDVTIELDEPLETVVTSSLKFVIILGEIERVFDIEIPEDLLDMENFKTINTIDKLIHQLQLTAS